MKSMIWIRRRVRPWLRSRTASTRRRRPGTKRSLPMRRRGPLGTSRMPVASTTMTPGSPSAKRPYQDSTSGVTKPSSVARQGTIAGTHERSRSTRPLASASGENSIEPAASAALGGRRRGSSWRMRWGGFHTSAAALQDPLGDDELLDLRRALVDAERPDLAVEPLHLAPQAHAGAAVELDRAVDDPLRRLGGVHL